MSLTLLETCSQSKLYYPRSAICRYLTEKSVHLLPGWIELRGGIHGRPLGMVEGVVKFAAKLQGGPLMDDEILECG